jgi:hypothetical protein
MRIKDYKKLTNTKELEKAHSNCGRWCNKYVRMRDIKYSEKNGYYFICIACGKLFEVNLFSDRSIYNGRNLQSSHYFNSDKFASVRYDLSNLHLSCERCNSPKGLHGNKEMYQKNLIIKIGKKAFEELEQRAHKIEQWNIVELEMMTEEFKFKARQRSSELNIKI